MSFSGKKFKRVASENVEKLIEASHISSDKAQLLLAEDSAFTFTLVGEHTYDYTLFFNGKTINSTFKVGKEHEMERRDGTKVKVTHFMESDNVLSQTITDSAGKQADFRREFDGNRCVLIISSPGSSIQAKIYYEAVE